MTGISHQSPVTSHRVLSPGLISLSPRPAYPGILPIMPDHSGRKGYYSFDRLEVYHLAVKLRRIVKEILASIPPGHEKDVDQPDRSTKSTIRTICEGAPEFRPREKARFYRMSLRSTEETGGSLRILEDDVGPHPLYEEAHAVNFELIAKLTALCRNQSRNRRNRGRLGGLDKENEPVTGTEAGDR
ncbi:MAG: four helix bundle protein [Gemmatimonadota bacterium]